MLAWFVDENLLLDIHFVGLSIEFAKILVRNRFKGGEGVGFQLNPVSAPHFSKFWSSKLINLKKCVQVPINPHQTNNIPHNCSSYILLWIHKAIVIALLMGEIILITIIIIIVHYESCKTFTLCFCYYHAIVHDPI